MSYKKIAFDVGANVGVKTQQLLDLGFDHVVAIEPLFNSPFAESDERVTWIKSLVSEDENPRDIYPLGTISTVETSFMEGRFKGAIWGEPVTVRSTTLNNLFDVFGIPEYIKIDVEGHELSVLRGLPNRAFVPFLSFEWHSEGREQALACVQLLESIGYDRFHLQFEDELCRPEDMGITTQSHHLMQDFDRMCGSRHLPWGQIWAKL